MHEEKGASRPRLVEPWRQLNLLQAKRPPQMHGLFYLSGRLIARSNAPHGKDPPTLWHAVRPIASQNREQKCFISLGEGA